MAASFSTKASATGPGGRIELSGPALAWMAGGEAHTLRLEAGGRGHRLTVAADVLAGAVGGVPGAARLRRFLGRSAAIAGPRLSPFLREITQSFEVLSRESKEPCEATPGIVAAHLALLYLHVSRSAAAEQGAGGAVPEGAGSIAQRFLNLVELHPRDGWTVKRYADALCVTEDRLHAVALRSHGKPPGLLVRERLLAEACSQLQATGAPVEQIAFALGSAIPLTSAASAGVISAIRQAGIVANGGRNGRGRQRIHLRLGHEAHGRKRTPEERELRLERIAPPVAGAAPIFQTVRNAGWRPVRGRIAGDLRSRLGRIGSFG